MSSSKVTILLPNYNNAPYLNECIDSILNQTYKNYHVVIIDDCSSDDSRDFLRIYESHPSFSILYKEKNSGIVDALNLGLDQDLGDYVMRLDGDDLMVLDRMEKLVSFMDQHPEIDICGSAIQCFGASEEIINYPEDPSQIKASLIFGHAIGHATCMFRSKIFNQLGFRYSPDYPYMEDYDLFYRLRDQVKCTSINEPYYLYRQLTRHSMEDLVQKKKDTYLAFYNRILNDLNCNYPNGSQIHFELAKKTSLCFKMSDYKKHINMLLDLNSETAMFPNQYLKTILNNALFSVACRLIDTKSVGLSSLLYDKRLVKYYFASKIKSR